MPENGPSQIQQDPTIDNSSPDILIPPGRFDDSTSLNQQPDTALPDGNSGQGLMMPENDTLKLEAQEKAKAEKEKNLSDLDKAIYKFADLADKNKLESLNKYRNKNISEKFGDFATRFGTKAAIGGGLGALLGGAIGATAGVAGAMGSEAGRGVVSGAKLISDSLRRKIGGGETEEDTLKRELSEHYSSTYAELGRLALAAREAMMTGQDVDTARLNFLNYATEMSNQESAINVQIKEKEKRYKKITLGWKIAEGIGSVIGGVLTGGAVTEAFRHYITTKIAEQGLNLSNGGIGELAKHGSSELQNMQSLGHHVHLHDGQVVFDYNPGEAAEIAKALTNSPEWIQHSFLTTPAAQELFQHGMHEAGMSVTQFNAEIAKAVSSQVESLITAIGIAAFSTIAGDEIGKVLRSGPSDNLHQIKNQAEKFKANLQPAGPSGGGGSGGSSENVANVEAITPGSVYQLNPGSSLNASVGYGDNSRTFVLNPSTQIQWNGITADGSAYAINVLNQPDVDPTDTVYINQVEFPSNFSLVSKPLNQGATPDNGNAVNTPLQNNQVGVNPDNTAPSVEPVDNEDNRSPENKDIEYKKGRREHEGYYWDGEICKSLIVYKENRPGGVIFCIDNINPETSDGARDKYHIEVHSEAAARAAIETFYTDDTSGVVHGNLDTSHMSAIALEGIARIADESTPADPISDLPDNPEGGHPLAGEKLANIDRDRYEYGGDFAKEDDADEEKERLFEEFYTAATTALKENRRVILRRRKDFFNLGKIEVLKRIDRKSYSCDIETETSQYAGSHSGPYSLDLLSDVYVDWYIEKKTGQEDESGETVLTEERRKKLDDHFDKYNREFTITLITDDDDGNEYSVGKIEPSDFAAEDDKIEKEFNAEGISIGVSEFHDKIPGGHARDNVKYRVRVGRDYYINPENKNKIEIHIESVEIVDEGKNDNSTGGEDAESTIDNADNQTTLEPQELTESKPKLEQVRDRIAAAKRKRSDIQNRRSGENENNTSIEDSSSDSLLKHEKSTPQAVLSNLKEKINDVVSVQEKIRSLLSNLADLDLDVKARESLGFISRLFERDFKFPGKKVEDVENAINKVVSTDITSTNFFDDVVNARRKYIEMIGQYLKDVNSLQIIDSGNSNITAEFDSIVDQIEQSVLSLGVQKIELKADDKIDDRLAEVEEIHLVNSREYDNKVHQVLASGYIMKNDMSLFDSDGERIMGDIVIPTKVTLYRYSKDGGTYPEYKVSIPDRSRFSERG